MHDLLLKTGSFIVLLGGLIFVHELGHFLVAKLLGVKVVRFSIGFGPRLVGIRRGETEYRISILPLGGYVKMAGDDPSEVVAEEDRGRGFLEQPPWRRLLIAIAGPAMNFVFPVVVYFAVLLAQNGTLVPAARIGSLSPGSPAAEAGLQPGDRILAVAEPGAAPRPVRYFTDLSALVSPHPGQPLVFSIEREGRTLPPVTITPATVPDTTIPFDVHDRGVIGITPSYTPAVVAPVRPGAAGPLQPFDLVVKVGDQKIGHAGDLRRVLAAAGCAPLDLEVVREQPVPVPGAPVSTYATLPLRGVPSCAGGQPTFAVAAPFASTFVAAVEPGSPAARAGLRRGDAIAAVDGAPVRSFSDIEARAAGWKPGKAVALALADGRRVTLVPAEHEVVERLTGDRSTVMWLGFHPDTRAVVDPDALLVDRVPLARGVLEAAGAAFAELENTVRLTVLGLVAICTGRVPFRQVGGPIMIFDITSHAVQAGLTAFLGTMALISVNLGLMNLLPIPVLDGGHVMTAVVEGVARRRLSIRTREIANLVGIVLLVLLMLVVFKNDIVRKLG